MIRTAHSDVALAAGRRGGRAFTIAELAVAVAIVAVLFTLLTSAVTSARQQARAVLCQANLKQLCAALHAYAGANDRRFPPNLSAPAPGQAWSDAPRLGRYVDGDLVTPSGKIGGSILVCPSDGDGARRSYAMNLWASSAIDPSKQNSVPNRGRLWGPDVPDAARMILVTEAWSSTGSDATGWFALPTIGYAGRTAGERFGGGGGVIPFHAGRWGIVNCELPYARHRQRGGPGEGTQPVGRVSIGYADGHVELRAHGDLVDATGTATGTSFWSPTDRDVPQ